MGYSDEFDDLFPATGPEAAPESALYPGKITDVGWSKQTTEGVVVTPPSQWWVLSTGEYVYGTLLDGRLWTPDTRTHRLVMNPVQPPSEDEGR